MDANVYAAHVANLEGALCALLREAAADAMPGAVPDAVAVRLDADSLVITYLNGDVAVAEEGM